MRINYLSLGFYVLTFLLALFILIYISATVGLVVFSLGLFIFFLFRRKKVIFRDNLSHTRDILTSPVHGQVYSIEREPVELEGEQFTLVRIVLPLFFESGLYSPASSEIVNRSVHKGGRFFRYAQSLKTEGISCMNLKFFTNTSKTFHMSVLKDWLGGIPYFWTTIGDRASCGGCLGFLPFGGTVLLYVPIESEIFVKEEDMLIAGQTSIAGFH